MLQSIWTFLSWKRLFQRRNEDKSMEKRCEKIRIYVYVYEMKIQYFSKKKYDISIWYCLVGCISAIRLVVSLYKPSRFTLLQSLEGECLHRKSVEEHSALLCAVIEFFICYFNYFPHPSRKKDANADRLFPFYWKLKYIH